MKRSAVAVNLTPSEKARLERAADDAGVTRSRLLLVALEAFLDAGGVVHERDPQRERLRAILDGLSARDVDLVITLAARLAL